MTMFGEDIIQYDNVAAHKRPIQSTTTSRRSVLHLDKYFPLLYNHSQVANLNIHWTEALLCVCCVAICLYVFVFLYISF